MPVAHAATNQRGRIRLAFRATRTIKAERDRSRAATVLSLATLLAHSGAEIQSQLRALSDSTCRHDTAARPCQCRGGLNVSLDAQPSRAASWRIIAERNHRDDRSAPVGVAQPSPQCLGVREIKIRGLDGPDPQSAFLFRPAQCRGRRSRTLNHRRHSRRVGVRSLNQQAPSCPRLDLMTANGHPPLLGVHCSVWSKNTAMGGLPLADVDDDVIGRSVQQASLRTSPSGRAPDGDPTPAHRC